MEQRATLAGKAAAPSVLAATAPACPISAGVDGLMVHGRQAYH
jgi:hypothetical protein